VDARQEQAPGDHPPAFEARRLVLVEALLVVDDAAQAEARGGEDGIDRRPVVGQEEVGALAQRLIRMRDGSIVSDTAVAPARVDGAGLPETARIATTVD
jgi:hypothetical protein